MFPRAAVQHGTGEILPKVLPEQMFLSQVCQGEFLPCWAPLRACVVTSSAQRCHRDATALRAGFSVVRRVGNAGLKLLQVKNPSGSVWRGVAQGWAPSAFPELVWMSKTQNLRVPEASDLFQLFSKSGELSEMKCKKPGMLFSK